MLGASRRAQEVGVRDGVIRGGYYGCRMAWASGNTMVDQAVYKPPFPALGINSLLIHLTPPHLLSLSASSELTERKNNDDVRAGLPAAPLLLLVLFSP